MKIQKHLEQYEHFTTTIDGIELLCLIEYYPAEGDGFNEPRYGEGCSLQYCILNGIDIYPLLGEGVIDQIEKKYMAEEKCDANY